MAAPYPIIVQSKVIGWAVMSRLAAAVMVMLSLLSAPALAHEVQPAVADVTIEGDSIAIELVATLEPYIAGVDLDGLLDTNASAKAKEVDRLRALGPAELEQAFRAAWPGLRESITLRAGETDLEPELLSIDVPEVGEVALPRLSRLKLSADLPADGTPVVIGWRSELGALVVRQMGAGPEGYTGYLTGGTPSDPIPRSGTVEQSQLRVFTDYIAIGFQHIIPKGLDHILFVLGLFFLAMRLKPLLWQISAFTLAHTITLAMGMLGLVSVPASVVEPLIAASIVYVGVENVLRRGLSPWRPAVVFAFGLLHGLGFASVLTEIGLSPSMFVTGLIGFNVGVELGQLAVIGVAFLVVGLWFGRKPWYQTAIANPVSITIALIGAFWVVERTVL